MHGSLIFPFFSTGSEAALASLLRANALQAIVYALSSTQALLIISFRSALARALRVLASAIIEVTGPTLAPIRTYSTQFRSEAKIALNYLFEVRCSLWVHDAYRQILLSLVRLLRGVPASFGRFFNAGFSSHCPTHWSCSSHGRSQNCRH